MGNIETINYSWFSSTPSFLNPYYTASTGPTVTSITINDPPTGPFSTGMGGSYYLDGEVVSDDTIVASDFTLYKDFQSYSNSNITMHGNHFELTKSGDGLYIIICGGIQEQIYYKDETWLSTISSSSSSRSTNSVRIRNLLAKIPSDIEGNILEFITGSDANGNFTRYGSNHSLGMKAVWKTFGRANFVKMSATDTKVSYVKTFTNGSHWVSRKYYWMIVFELGNVSNEIKWRIKQYKWFDDFTYNHSLVGHEFPSPWFEVGSNNRAIWWWSNDPSSTLPDDDGTPVSNYDSWLVDERNYILFYDWIYY